MNRSLVRQARAKGDKIVLAVCAITAYALALIPPYSTTDIGVVTLAAAPVLSAAWLLGFWGGLAAALLSFPLNAYVLDLTGQNGWELVTQPGALQGSVLVLVLGVVVGGLRDVGGQLEREASARRAIETAREETDARYRKLADSASDGILTLDTELRILYANPRSTAIFGRDAAALEASSLGELFGSEKPGGDLAQLHDYLTQLRAGGRPRPVELATRRPDGSVVEVEVSFGASTMDGDPVFTSIVRDVTERKQFERELQHARIEAIQATRAKSEFISRMSHELRTPLNSIIGYAQLVDTGPLAEDDRDGMTQIVRAGRHLLSLVDEVLDIARIEAGRLDLVSEVLDPADVAAEARDLLRPRAAERDVGIQISPSGRFSVVADRQRLRQVMLNLLSNSVKYIPHGGTVRVDGSVEGDRVAIVVEDDGPGVPEDKVPRLFTPFDRLGAERSGVEGTGVGLSLTRHLVEAMGGEIGYERAPAGGARFRFTLPVAPSVPDEEVPEREILPNAR